MISLLISAIYLGTVAANPGSNGKNTFLQSYYSLRIMKGEKQFQALISSTSASATDDPPLGSRRKKAWRNEEMKRTRLDVLFSVVILVATPVLSAKRSKPFFVCGKGWCARCDSNHAAVLKINIVIVVKVKYSAHIECSG